MYLRDIDPDLLLETIVLGLNILYRLFDMDRLGRIIVLGTLRSSVGAVPVIVLVTVIAVTLIALIIGSVVVGITLNLRLDLVLLILGRLYLLALAVILPGAVVVPSSGIVAVAGTVVIVVASVISVAAVIVLLLRSISVIVVLCHFFLRVGTLTIKLYRLCL